MRQGLGLAFLFNRQNVQQCTGKQTGKWTKNNQPECSRLSAGQHADGRTVTDADTTAVDSGTKKREGRQQHKKTFIRNRDHLIVG